MMDKITVIKNKIDINTLKIKGIYFLINGSEIVYVGKSVDVLNRIKSHISSNEIDFDYYFYEEKSDFSSSELSQYEKQLIYLMNPKYNKIHSIDHSSRKDGMVNIKTKITRDQADFLIKLSMDESGVASITQGIRILIVNAIRNETKK